MQTSRLLHTLSLRVVGGPRSFTVTDIKVQHLNRTFVRSYADTSSGMHGSVPYSLFSLHQLGEIYTEVVPGMGDSISEGTVAKWHKGIL